MTSGLASSGIHRFPIFSARGGGRGEEQSAWRLVRERRSEAAWETNAKTNGVGCSGVVTEKLVAGGVHCTPLWPVPCRLLFFRSINPVQAVSLEHGGPAGRQPCGFFFVGCSSPTHCAAGPSAVDAVVHTAQKQLAHVVSETLL
jgi:hypothetical protein